MENLENLARKFLITIALVSTLAAIGCASNSGHGKRLYDPSDVSLSQRKHYGKKSPSYGYYGRYHYGRNIHGPNQHNVVRGRAIPKDRRPFKRHRYP